MWLSRRNEPSLNLPIGSESRRKNGRTLTDPAERSVTVSVSASASTKSGWAAKAALKTGVNAQQALSRLASLFEPFVQDRTTLEADEVAKQLPRARSCRRVASSDTVLRNE